MRGFFRVNMRPSYVSHVQNVSPSPTRLSFDGKTRMFRRVFFNVFACFLGVCFWGLCRLLCLFGWFVMFRGVFSGFVVLTLPMWLVCSVPCCVLCV